MKLQQVLHGYAEGHRQLSASIVLKPRDVKTMLVLSDISSTGAQIGNSGYLTGYPLVDSGMYALARTWAAPEMSRPGCVWTHTILIEFADLAKLTSFDCILTLFKRPIGLSFVDRGDPLIFNSSPDSESLSSSDQQWGRSLLTALYANPHARIIAIRPPEADVDRTVLAIWSQQWPRLRRTFRFCTMTSADRSVEGNSFDLQLLPSMERSVRVRFPGATDAEGVEASLESWLEDAVGDLVRPDIEGLRTFMRRMGADVAAGRGAFRSLCKLYRLLRRLPVDIDAILDSIVLLESEFSSSQVRAAREMVVNSAFICAGKLNDSAFSYLFEQIDLVSADIIGEHIEKFGRAAWLRNPRHLISLIERKGLAGSAWMRVFNGISAEELILGLAKAPELVSFSLNVRPDILIDPGFWSLQGVDDAFLLAKESPDLLFSVVSALVSANRDDLAPIAVSDAGSFNVLKILGSEIRQSGWRQELVGWLEIVLRDSSAVAQYLSNNSTKSLTLLAAIARSTDPDSVPNDVGEDPWIVAYENADGELSFSEMAYLRAYFLSRALGTRSRNMAELAKLGFESTYMLAASDTLPVEAWRLIDYRLPRSFFWFEWDRCLRMRAAIVDLFVDRGLAPRFFLELTQDGDLFVSLAKFAARSTRGRRYLGAVYEAMHNQSETNLGYKIREIDELLR